MLQPGDRVRCESTGEDGFPLVRYGFVGGCNPDGSRVVVMFDGELKGDQVVDLDQLEPVSITNVELRLRGSDLLDDPSLRQGLVSLWSAEADQAGLEVHSIEQCDEIARSLADDPALEGLTLAEIESGGRSYVLQALADAAVHDLVRVRAITPPH